MAELQRRKVKKTAVPQKSTINMAMKEQHKTTIVTLATGIILIAILAFLVAKWGVIDQQARLQSAESEYNKVHEQNLEIRDYVEDYPAVLREYRSISRAWMQTEDGKEVVKVDRQAVLDMVEREMRPRGIVQTIQINSDTLVSTMSGMTLKQVSAMLESIEKYPIVSLAMLNSAETDEDTEGDILKSFSLTIYLRDPGEGVK